MAILSSGRKMPARKARSTLATVWIATLMLLMVCLSRLLHFGRTQPYLPLAGYYDGATELYEYGWAKSFHFSRFYKGESFAASLARHEHYLSSYMQLRPGMRVLDVGCGVGGPAREIAQFSDANIVGLNNNDFQVLRARKYTKQAGLENQVTFVKGDFMKLAEQFGENSFDAVYAIEATCHAPTWEGVYGEIMKVLKPGGVVSAASFFNVNTFAYPRHHSSVYTNGA
jgi:sterol 24-C-methyltransferase